MVWLPRHWRFCLTLLGLGVGALLNAGVASAQSPQPAPAAKLPAQPPPAELIAPPASAGVGNTAPVPAAEIVDSGCAINPFWLKNPPVPVVPQPGFFTVLPTGPGYYSLLDCLTGNYREKPPAFGYPRFAIMAPSLFDADWRYVDQPGYEPDWLERLHRIHLGDNWMFATGGEFRFRYNDEINSRLTGKSNDYELTRVRVFTDLWYKDIFRIYVEFIDAQSFNQDTLPPLPIDREYAGLQNAFVDLKFFEDGNGTGWYVRGGRQEIMLGSQRLVSALDWANTRRTFDGVRVFRHGEDWDIDAWWLRVVIPSPTQVSTSDPQQNFAGLFTEYRPNKNQAIDLYTMYLSNDDLYNLKTKTPVPAGELATAPYTVWTLGGRWSGKLNCNSNILFDTENMLQLGHSNFQPGNIVAGSVSEGIGYNFPKLPMNPTFWAYFDYATGTSGLGSGGQMSTFNQLYPFGHYYYGWLDDIGRDNIQDINFNLYLYPTKWITVNLQYHILSLASATDALYNSGGQVVRFDATGKFGRDVGQEATFICNFHLTPRQDILVAYAHLWEGTFLRGTGTGGKDQDSWWLMYTFRW
jgi:Alginate export